LLLEEQLRKVQTLVQQNKVEEAAALLIQYIDSEPENPIHYINFANLLFELNELERAERFYVKAISLNEEVATAYFGLGNIHYERGNFQKAIELFQKAIAVGLEHSDVFYMIGMAYVKSENTLYALSFLQRAAELDSTVNHLFQYGLALAQTNYLKEAKKVFLKVIDQAPEHADSLYNLAIIAIHEEEKLTALQLLNKTLHIEPEHLLARQALELIEVGCKKGK